MDPNVLERLLAAYRRQLADLYEEARIGATWPAAQYISDAIDALDEAASRSEQILRKGGSA